MTHPKTPTGRRLTIHLLLLAGLLLVTGGAFVLPYWIPTAIVYAPNFGKKADSLREVSSEQLEAWGINQQIHIPVGQTPRFLPGLINPTELAVCGTANRPRAVVKAQNRANSFEQRLVVKSRLTGVRPLATLLDCLRVVPCSSSAWEAA